VHVEELPAHLLELLRELHLQLLLGGLDPGGPGALDPAAYQHRERRDGHERHHRHEHRRRSGRQHHGPYAGHPHYHHAPARRAPEHPEVVGLELVFVVVRKTGQVGIYRSVYVLDGLGERSQQLRAPLLDLVADPHPIVHGRRNYLSGQLLGELAGLFEVLDLVYLRFLG
jgi:hypothetical protein